MIAMGLKGVTAAQLPDYFACAKIGVGSGTLQSWLGFARLNVGCFADMQVQTQRLPLYLALAGPK